MRILLLFIFMAFPPIEVWAKSMRVVRLSESDMETVFVEPGFSTLIKFDSHPQPGLVGDQDGFKVEYAYVKHYLPGHEEEPKHFFSRFGSRVS